MGLKNMEEHSGTAGSNVPVSYISTMYTDYEGSEIDIKYHYAEDMLTEFVFQGEPEKILDFIIRLKELNIPMGAVAETPLRAVKNIFISSTAIIRHVSIKAGLNPELASRLCDQYDCAAERKTDVEEIKLFIFQMMIDYAARIKKIKEHRDSSPLVLAVINDIHAHIYEPLSTGIVAERLNYSKGHLCRQFKLETNMTIQNYIQQQKIEEAKHLLRHTDYSLLEIAVNLNFQSQSYFQKVFLRQAGITPAKYRNRKYFKTKTER